MNTTKQELILELSTLAEQMRRIADKLDTLDDTWWSAHARQVRGAASMAETWVEGLKSELRSKL